MINVLLTFCENLCTEICKAKEEDKLDLKTMGIEEVNKNLISIIPLLPHIEYVYINGGKIPTFEEQLITTVFNKATTLRRLEFSNGNLTIN